MARHSLICFVDGEIHGSSLPGPEAPKQPQTITIPPPYFTVGMISFSEIQCYFCAGCNANNMANASISLFLTFHRKYEYCHCSTNWGTSRLPRSLVIRRSYYSLLHVICHRIRHTYTSPMYVWMYAGKNTVYYVSPYCGSIVNLTKTLGTPSTPHLAQNGDYKNTLIHFLKSVF